MARPVEPLPELPSDRLQVGACEVMVSRREIFAPGARRPVRVTPKAMGVLRVLVENADKVVSRDALLTRVWPDTLPTDDVLTQAITQLRKAFGEIRGQTSYIETIAKSGYRLLAPVAWVSDDAYDGEVSEVDAATTTPPTTLIAPPAAMTAAVAVAPTADASSGRETAIGQSAVAVQAHPRKRWGILIAAVTLLLVGVAAGLWWRGPGGRHAATPQVAAPRAPAALRYQLITSAPGYEFAPALSPDASMVAYMAAAKDSHTAAILLQAAGQSVPRPLVVPPQGLSDRIPAWSPDGREIAFQRRHLGGRHCEIIVVGISGRDARSVTQCDPTDLMSFTWTPDGRGLVFGSMHMDGVKHGIRVLDLASGKWRALAYDTDADALDIAPRYSPDGKWIGFIRNPALGDLWRIPAAGGRAERLTRIDGEIGNWDWTPDGRGLLFDRFMDSESRLFQLDLATGKVRDLGVDDIEGPDVAARRPVLAFVKRRTNYNLYRVRRDRSGTPQPLFASSGRDTQPAIAPDGRQLVFASGRSGQRRLWWADVQQPDTLRMIPGVLPGDLYPVEWSADSRHLLVAGTGGDGRYGVHEITAANGQARLLPVPVPQPLQAVYLSDPGHLLVLEEAQGSIQTRLSVFDRSQRPWRRLASIDGVSFAKFDPAGRRVLFSRTAVSGLWSADLQLSPASVRQVDATAPSHLNYRSWTVAGDGSIDYLEQTRECRTGLRRLGTPIPATLRCLSTDTIASTTGLSSDATADVVYLSMVTFDGSDIGISTLPSAPTN